MSDMNDDRLNTLRNARTPAPSDAARRRALDAAMLSFDAALKNSFAVPQGERWSTRLRSIFHTLKGNWIMDSRISIGFGTAAIALLLLPLGYQLYATTAITPPGFETRGPSRPAEMDMQAATGGKDSAGTLAAGDESAEAATPLADLAVADTVAGRVREEAASAGADAMNNVAAPPVAEREVARKAGVPQQQVAGGPRTATTSVAAPTSVAAMPTPEPSLTPQVAASGDAFTDFDESAVKVVADEPVSTFSIDVDTASYAYVRRMLGEGYLPQPDSIRIEEMINYFDYAYPLPHSAATPFLPNVQVYPTPWNDRTQLVQIGIKGYVPPASVDKASNLVFLLDTSGSMDTPDKLPLLKRAFALLVDQLSANDTVSIVAYAGSAGVVLEPTRATDKASILAALDNLHPRGSTAGAEGIELAYRLAAENKVDGINRVILATDGDFNVGIADPDALVDFIKEKRDQGVFLSVLGFGQGNLGDDTMQALAQNGNGNASYIDSFKEAQKVLVQEIGGTLETIAKDVKIQVEFNPAVVAEYRLIGYETRALNREDFNNDRVDAGEIGAGHTVTALYEISPVGSGGELVDPLRYNNATTPTANVLPSDEVGFLKIRYKLPEGSESILIETPISTSQAVDRMASASDDARWAAAVAAFAQKLKGSDYVEMRWEDIRRLASGARGEDADGYRAEFIQLIDLAAALRPEPFCTAPAGNRNCR